MGNPTGGEVAAAELISRDGGERRTEQPKHGHLDAAKQGGKSFVDERKAEYATACVNGLLFVGKRLPEFRLRGFCVVVVHPYGRRRLGCPKAKCASAAANNEMAKPIGEMRFVSRVVVEIAGEDDRHGLAALPVLTGDQVQDDVEFGELFVS